MGGRADQLNPTHLFVVHLDGALWTAGRAGVSAARVRRTKGRRTPGRSCRWSWVWWRRGDPATVFVAGPGLPAQRGARLGGRAAPARAGRNEKV